MLEGDDEDLWLKCLDTAYDILAIEGKDPYPSAFTRFATQLFNAAKAACEPYKKDAKPKAIVQLKGV